MIKGMNKNFIIGALGCVLLGALASVGLYYVSQQHKGVQLGQTKLVGTLYLTLNPVAHPSDINIHTFNLANRTLAPLLANGRINITPGLSASGNKLVYMSRGKNENAFQIYGMTTDKQAFFQMTEDANQFKREPVWSSDDMHVAYSVQTASAASASSLQLPNSWLVFITNLAKEAKLAGLGANPFFSPDGKVLYALQNDGIHGVSVASLYPAPTKSKTATATQSATFGPLLVPTIAGTVATNEQQATSTAGALKNMKISVSPDGKRLAWSVPTRGFVRIFAVTSWAPLTLAPEKDLPVTALFSTFSPNSQYLALEQVVLDANKQFVNPKIVIYSSVDWEKVEALDLSAYTTKYLWLSAWR